MKQDIREMSYVFQKEKADKEIIYTIDLLLRSFFEKEFDREDVFNWSIDFVDRKYFELLDDRDSIIDDIIRINYKDNYFCHLFINDVDKLYYLIDTEFLKELDKSKKYYDKRLKTRNKVKDRDLIDTLKTYFEYCFVNCNKTDSEEILKLMSSSSFRKATIDDLKIDTSRYLDFDKTYNKALNEFKKIHKDDIDDNNNTDNKIGFGWLFYGTIKAIEGLFKL